MSASRWASRMSRSVPMMAGLLEIAVERGALVAQRGQPPRELVATLDDRRRRRLVDVPHQLGRGGVGERDRGLLVRTHRPDVDRLEVGVLDRGEPGLHVRRRQAEIAQLRRHADGDLGAGGRRRDAGQRGVGRRQLGVGVGEPDRVGGHVVGAGLGHRGAAAADVAGRDPEPGTDEHGRDDHPQVPAHGLYELDDVHRPRCSRGREGLTLRDPSAGRAARTTWGSRPCRGRRPHRRYRAGDAGGRGAAGDRGAADHANTDADPVTQSPITRDPVIRDPRGIKRPTRAPARRPEREGVSGLGAPDRATPAGGDHEHGTQRDGHDGHDHEGGRVGAGERQVGRGRPPPGWSWWYLPPPGWSSWSRAASSVSRGAAWWESRGSSWW